MKNISFLSENFQFLEMKFSIFLNRHVFVMNGHTCQKVLCSHIAAQRQKGVTE